MIEIIDFEALQYQLEVCALERRFRLEILDYVHMLTGYFFFSIVAIFLSTSETYECIRCVAACKA